MPFVLNFLPVSIMTTTTLSKNQDKEADSTVIKSSGPYMMPPPSPAKDGKVNNNGSINGSTSDTLTTNGDSEEVFRVYKRRWLILALFVLYSSSNAFQWIQYAIINDIVTSFYKVGASWVDWTSLIYMFVYIPLIFPATFLLQKKVNN